MTKPEITEEEIGLCCNFCGLSKNVVRQLIAGPSVFICDQCSITCLAILIEENVEARQELLEFVLEKIQNKNVEAAAKVRKDAI